LVTFIFTAYKVADAGKDVEEFLFSREGIEGRG